MKRVIDVYSSMLNQQKYLIKEIKNVIHSSGNLKGIPQWRDRSSLHKLTEKVSECDYLLQKKDFQLLERLHFKYKV